MKKRILFLTPRLPYPAISGGVVKSNKMVDYLSRNYDLSMGFFLKDDDGKNVDHYLATLSLRKCFYIGLYIARSGDSFLRSIFFNVPMSVYRNKSSIMKKEIENMAKDCDVIIVDHFLMFQYVPAKFTGRIVLHQHNAEFVLWQRFSDTQRNLIKRALIAFEAFRIKKYESFLMKNSHCVLAAPNDIEVLSPLIDDNKKFVETYHLGDEKLLEEPELEFSGTSKSLLYIGTLTWEANRDGLYWFLEKIWPSLKINTPELIFNIIGKLQDQTLFTRWLSDPNIKWHGFVDDLCPFYNSARVFVSPLRFGSGIKVKVINSLYRGLPVVTTSVGTEGLTVINEQHVCICDTEKKYVKMVEKLLSDKDYWYKVSRQSRALAREKYTWDYVLKNLSKAIEND